MEAVATAVLDEKERERQEQIKKLQNETCFIGHPFGVGVMNFKFMMGQITGYGMTAIFIYYLYAAAPEGVGLTKVQASQIITLDAALASIFSIVGSFMADRVFGNRRAYRFCTITGPFFYFSLAIPRLGIIGVVLYCCIGYLNSMVAGSSMYSLLGKLYAQGDKRRDGAFSIQYVLSNIGARSTWRLRSAPSARSAWSRTIRCPRSRRRRRLPALYSVFWPSAVCSSSCSRITF